MRPPFRKVKNGGLKWIIGHGKPGAWDGNGRVTRMVRVHIELAARHRPS